MNGNKPYRKLEYKQKEAELKEKYDEELKSYKEGETYKERARSKESLVRGRPFKRPAARSRRKC